MAEINSPTFARPRMRHHETFSNNAWRTRSLPTFLEAARLQQSFLAVPEKKLLIRLAAKIPAWVKPDHLTVLGFFAQCAAGGCYVLAKQRPAALVIGVACLALNWFGDSLDGTLARVRNQQRPRYGFYIDHISDSIAALCMTAGLALSGYINPGIGVGMLTGFLLLSIEAYLTTYTLGKFELSYWKFGPTEIRILLAVGNLALLKYSMVEIAGMRLRLFDIGGVIAICGMALMLVNSIIRGHRLAAH